MESEIQEENGEDTVSIINKEAQKEMIRRIIEHQKSLYWSSSHLSSLSSSASSACSFSASSSCRNDSLLNLMKNGSTSLRRLFDMEHTSLETHFEHYSGPPMVKSIPLWGSDTDDEQMHDPWASIEQFGTYSDFPVDGLSKFASEGSFMDVKFGFQDRKQQRRNRTLTRKRSFRRLPGFRLWRFKGFRFRFRLFKRIRIMICGRIF
ncbi:hypothetical protein HS088_TW13G00106 [Tripterygium wilfordii]|uniref:Uncharacterized protein n=1 Tax=Tripterygium wilfordii TaxID=458696 RepID=A0A7J7CSZ2_TRIWF|nr:hypothetical protein HS088_TW13G00106 [Tripterygium wilfordii]